MHVTKCQHADRTIPIVDSLVVHCTLCICCPALNRSARYTFTSFFAFSRTMKMLFVLRFVHFTASSHPCMQVMQHQSEIACVIACSRRKKLQRRSRTDVLCTSLPGMIWRGALRCLSTLQGPTCTTTRRSFTRRRSLLHRTRRGVGTTTLKCTPTGGGSHVRLLAHPLLFCAYSCSLSVLHRRHLLSLHVTTRRRTPHDVHNTSRTMLRLHTRTQHTHIHTHTHTQHTHARTHTLLTYVLPITLGWNPASHLGAKVWSSLGLSTRIF